MGAVAKIQVDQLGAEPHEDEAVFFLRVVIVGGHGEARQTSCAPYIKNVRLLEVEKAMAKK
ncbi:MAG: hypothetical protein NT158_07940 [Cyanobacteria bacterium]|nr:hypothetical protein [Cyanobacteriota bacterium]